MILGYNRTDSSPTGVWSENMNMQSSRNNEMLDTFDFLVKSEYNRP